MTWRGITKLKTLYIDGNKLQLVVIKVKYNIYNLVKGE